MKPIVTYGIEAIWPDLKVHHFEALDGCKCDFLKKTLGVHRSVRNRLVIMFCQVPLLSEELALKYGSTPEYENYLSICEEKFADVDPDVHLSPAMTQKDWMGPRYEKRHLVLRSSIHGFHFKLCSLSCHSRSPTCVCKLCKGSAAALLHVFVCPYLKDKGLSYVNDLE